MRFDDLGLSDKVLAAVTAAGYSEPTPIQSGAIPKVLERRDVLGLAQTGTGKTASFVLPMLSILEKGRARARMPRTLILEPTRELAAQVADSFAKYGVNHKLTIALLIGGVSFGDQDRKIDRGADVVIATPGRLLDHIERGKLLLRGIEILVIDEADRMLDMGFIPDIERICKILPFARQTLFFSATMPKEIQKLVDSFLHNPERVEVSPTSSAAETVSHQFVASALEPKAKRETLRKLIRGADNLTNAIIFCNRKRDIGTLYRSLERHGFSVGALHGDMDQRSRTNTLESFKVNEITLLVASDVAARGLDIPAVSHIFNYDVPHTSDDYIHRIGRTGRAGRTGMALSIATPADRKSLAAIETMLGRPLEWEGAVLGDRGADSEAASPRSGRSRSRSEGKPASARRPSARSGAETSAEPQVAAPSFDPATSEQPHVAPPGPDAEAAEAAEAGAAAAKAPRRGKPERQPSRGGPAEEGRSRRSRGQDEGKRRQPQREQEPVFGESEYVPAFLLRSIGQRAAPPALSGADEDYKLAS